MKHSLRLALLVAVLAVLLGGTALAASIGPDVTVTGSVEYDTGFSFVDNATHGGDLTAIVGGAPTMTTYGASSAVFQAGSAVGANPLAAVLTDIFDGFGLTGTAATGSTANADAEFGIGIDLAMTITNTSGTDVWEVTLGYFFSNSAEAVGTDAYVDSEFTLDQRLLPAAPPGTEVLFTSVITDTVFGNEVGGNPVAGFGGLLAESGSGMLVLTLNPGDSIVLEGDWTMEGGGFDDATSQAFLRDFEFRISVDDVKNPPIPEPGTLALLGLGLAGLAGTAVVRRRRKSAPRC